MGRKAHQINMNRLLIVSFWLNLSVLKNLFDLWHTINYRWQISHIIASMTEQLLTEQAKINFIVKANNNFELVFSKHLFYIWGVLIGDRKERSHTLVDYISISKCFLGHITKCISGCGCGVENSWPHRVLFHSIIVNSKRKSRSGKTVAPINKLRINRKCQTFLSVENCLNNKFAWEKLMPNIQSLFSCFVLFI